jgi:hypothetical protein
MRDKSGRGNHATAPSDAARPVLQADAGGLLHLTFNGSSQSMSTNNLDFTSTDKITICTGITKSSDAARSMLFEFSASTTNPGTFSIEAPSVAGQPRFSLFNTGTLTVSAGVNNAAYAAPTTNVLTVIGNISAPLTTLRSNGAQIANNTATLGTGNYGNYPLFIGSRNNSGFRYNGRIYGMIVRGAQSTAAQITSTERWMAGKTGVTI